MIEQRTPEWYQVRAGKITASRLCDVMAYRKDGKETAARKHYRAELVAGQLTNEPRPNISAAALRWGAETEAQARAAYEFVTDRDVVETGFIIHPQCELFGASPDGLIGDDGLVEFKCPNTATHIETLSSSEIEPDYIFQIQGQMACTERQWCDFQSFDPSLPPEFRLFITRVVRCEETITKIMNEVRLMLDQVAADIEAMRTAVSGREAA